mgnify:FL=1
MGAPLAVRAVPSLAERAWFTPPPLSTRVREKWEIDLAGTEPIFIELDGEDLEGLITGDGPVVFLAHGWGGRASQMARLAKAIAAEGFTALAINSPGHGGPGLAQSNVFRMAEGLHGLVDRYGPPHAIVAHSLGAMAAIHAFAPDLPSRVALVAPVLDVEEVLDIFAARARLFPWAATRLERRVRSFIGPHWDSFAAGPRTDLGDSEVLIIHDPEDRDAPFATSAALAAIRDKTYLHVADGLGHHSVLRDPAALKTVADFVRRGPSFSTVRQGLRFGGSPDSPTQTREQEKWTSSAGRAVSEPSKRV